MSNLSPWIDGFTKAVRQNYNFIKGAVVQGIGKTATYNMLKAGGVAGKKQLVLKMWQDLKDAYTDVSNYLDQSDPTAKPNPDLIKPAMGRQQKTYSYVIEYKATSAITGFNFRETITINSGKLLDVQEMHDLAFEAANPYGYVDEVDKDSFVVKDVRYSDDPIYRV